MWSLRYVSVVVMVIFVAYSKGNNDSLTVYNGPQRLIFGGKEFNIKDAPFMALYFLSNNAFVCGACIIHERILIYAAHCYNSKYRHYIKVGTDRIDGGQRYDIDETILHPKYDPKKLNNDVALIKLTKSLRFSDQVLRIRLAPRNLVLNPGDMLVTMGFGRNEKYSPSPRLLKVKIPYMSNSECREMFERRNWLTVTEAMMCAGGVGGKDACNGDSGGPLVFKHFLVGVVSYGDSNCGSMVPGVFARISALRDFIDSAIFYLNRNW